MKQNSLEYIETRLLLEGVYQRYGYDFRNYALSSLSRRIKEAVRLENVSTISELQSRILHEEETLIRFLDLMSINVSSMFRDPPVYAVFREKVVPAIKSIPFIRIWSAGCGIGEEPYSLAILLEEEGLYERTLIYATDMNPDAIEKAKTGIFPLNSIKDFTDNYIKSGGKRDFSEYYTANYGNAIIKTTLRRNIFFAQHNLVTDASFNEFHIIFCRNVMIYFNKTLTDQVCKLLYNSLEPYGYLVIGAKESLDFTPIKELMVEIDGKYKIYRRS